MTETTTISRNKRILFNIILGIIPFILLLLLEFTLRVAEIGDDYPLFKTYHENSKLYVANPDVSLKFFSRKDMTGFGTVDSFWKTKQENSKRIFVLGGSTTAGYPYFFNGGFPSILKQQLERSYPETAFEVVNLGMTAVNSYTVRDFARECLNYKPDLFIIYSGHNEFYGALGTGSNQGGWFGGRLWNFALIELRQWRLYQLMKSVIGAVNISREDSKPIGTETLMSQLAEEQNIKWNSNLYHKTLDIFEDNITDIIKWAETQDVPILIGTVASNVRDQKPYVSIHHSDIDKNEDQTETEITAVRSLMLEGQFESALLKIESMLQVDSTYALLHFYAGRCCEFISRYDEARRYYENARNYDGLRFRASSDLNDRIRQLKNFSNVYISEVESHMIHTSENGLIGTNFMLEHLHPNEAGNIIIAESFILSILQEDLLKLESPESKETLTGIAITELDRSIANFRIRILTSGWPFSPQNRYITTANLPQKNKADSVAIQVLQNKISYWEAHIKMATYYRNRGESEKAIDEYKTLVQAFPNVWKSHKAIAEYLIELERYDSALDHLKRAADLDGDTYCYKMAGSILLQKNQSDKAPHYLLIACEMSPDDPQARYNLSGAYYKLGEIEKAKDELRIIMKQHPNYKQAKSFFNQIH